MAKLETEHVFEASRSKVFSAIRQYDRYPEYMPGMTGCKVLPPKKPKSICQVRYELRIIKEFFYVLDMFETEPSLIRWELDDSNIMTLNEGSWKFKEKGAEQTKAIYTLEVKLKGFVPSAITDRVAAANVPAMMEGFQKLINDFQLAN